VTTLELIWWCVAGPILAWWVLLAFGSAMQARKFANLFLRQRRAAYDQFRPPAVVIIPCKGADPQLADNLAAILRQNYPTPYRAVLVAQSEDDPAVPVIRNAIAAAEADPDAHAAELLIAGDAPPNLGQKVHNQLTALRHLGLDRLAASEKFDDAHHTAALTPDTALVFADSDAVPGPDWLGNLVGPLAQTDKTAVTTGYRWLVPPPAGMPDPHPHVTALASVMNSSVLSFAGTGRFDFAWGGSMAMLTQTAIDGDLLGHFDGALCDDYQVTRMARKLNKRVYFVHRCIVASPDAWNWQGLRDFAFRQYLLTRKYTPGLYALALLMLWAYPAGVLAAVAGLLTVLEDRKLDLVFIVVLGVTVAVHIMNWLRHRSRLTAMQRALHTEINQRMRPVRCLDRLYPWAWMSLHAWLATRALFSNRMTWRGITYRLDGPQRCERIDPPPASTV